MRRVNVGLKDSVHKQAKIISILKDVKMNDYLVEAIEAAIKKDSSLLKKIKNEEN